MIPNDEQVLAIRQYLSKHLNYRETKYEMFDHILTALEHQANDITFGEAMNRVINDIGGIKGLKSIEFAAKWASMGYLFKSYKSYALNVLNSPSAVLSAAGAGVLCFYLSQNGKFLTHFWPLSVMLFNCIPQFMIKRSVMRERYPVNVKNAAFKNVYLIMAFITSVTVFSSVFLIKSHKELIPLALSVIIFLTAVHGVILYKLSRAEFKVTIAEN